MTNHELKNILNSRLSAHTETNHYTPEPGYTVLVSPPSDNNWDISLDHFSTHEEALEYAKEQCLLDPQNLYGIVSNEEWYYHMGKIHYGLRSIERVDKNKKVNNSEDCNYEGEL